MPPAPAPARPAEAGPTPPAIAAVERQIADVRGLSFLRPVPVDAVTASELARRLRGSLDAALPVGMAARRTTAWRTIGVIPPGSSIRRATKRFARGQVIGFYVPESGRLVFTGSSEPNGLERFTLSHELTHALDDQHFHLERTDRLSARCDDEASSAALGAIEGSATYFSLAYARRYLSLADVGSLVGGAIGAPSVAGVPPFIVRLEIWPYTAGEAFVAARQAAGGRRAVDEALRRFPATTEQVIHPSRYPADVPRGVDVPDYGPALGPRWQDLDVMGVGEAWLSTMLALRLEAATARAAAAGWDGGMYRAWSNGDRAAVVLTTDWDSPADAIQFANALRSWIDGGSVPGAVADRGGRVVSAAFAGDPRALERLRTLLSTGSLPTRP
jgi:hypothetical protein